ncbi:MAG: PQQ-binding-like beta-propeller repeat protein [Candidatus Aenigmarchaeota archaeon]|nr:PQQ-binding-like beta-propeller repeat protein [Candidatus Aenigmarchaeota archaeon]
MDYEIDEEKESDFHIDSSKAASPFRAWDIVAGGSILSSPIVHDDTIFFGANDTYFYALDLEGNKLWDYKTADMIFGAPACYKDTVIVGSADEYLYAFSKNGDLKWKFLAGSKIWSAPLIAEGIVYFGSNNGIFHALSIEDGKELWSKPNFGSEFFYSAGIVNDRIIFGNFNGNIYCISTDGDAIWELSCGGPISQSPLIVDDKNTELSSFRRRSFSKIPRCDKPRIFLGAGDGYFRCIGLDGKILWKTFANKIGASSPTINDKTIYFGSFDGSLYAVDVNGRVIWKFQTSNRVFSSPIQKDGIVYFGSSDHNFYAVDAKKGGLAWRFLTDGEIGLAPSIHNDAIYFGSWDGHMYAISLKDNTLLWKFRTALGFPSYMRKPTMVSEEPKKKIEFVQTETTKGYDVKRDNYSSVTGERTNSFYTTNMTYKNKTPYDRGMDKY